MTAAADGAATGEVDQQLLDELRDALEAAGASSAELGPAWRELSDGYRSGRATPDGAAFTSEHAQAYAVGRAPATTAAVGAVMAEVVRWRPDWQPTSMVDVGAGLGTASWRAMADLPSLRSVELVERSPAMIDLGRRLGSTASASAVRGRVWRRGDVTDLGDSVADVVLASYVLSELDDALVDSTIDSWWRSARVALVIVDTGTPAGFARVRAARARLTAGGAAVVAPCPSGGACPMVDSDWCHFAVRLPRSGAHRTIKGAELPFEDEKFSYLVVTRDDVPGVAGRVVRHPQVRSGHVRLQVCHDERIDEVVVARSRRDLFRWARKAEWGDVAPAELIDDL